MKTVKQLLLSILLINGLYVFSFGQNIVLTQSNQSGIYKKGEKIQVSVFLNEIKSDSLTVKTRENYSEHVSTKKMKYSGDTLIVFSGSFKKPSSIILDVDVDTKSVSTGLVVDPEHFQPGNYIHVPKKGGMSGKFLRFSIFTGPRMRYLLKHILT